MGPENVGRLWQTAMKTRAAVAAMAVLAAIAVVAASGTRAGAETAQKDGVRVSVFGSLTPKALPRRGRAPVDISIAGSIKAVAAHSLPQLQVLSIAMNREGKLDPNAVPRCRLGQIDPSTTSEALAACRPSLVGEGTFTADVRLPEQSPFPSKGKLLAFNGRLRGQPAIFAHIYGTKPVPTAIVLPFLVKRSKGTFGTILEAHLPQVTGDWGYVTGLSLKVGSGFSKAGRGDYISAGCPALSGSTLGVFSLMKTTFQFKGGLRLHTVQTRTCKVKR